MNNDLITKSNEIIQTKTNNSTHLQNQVVASLIANRMSNFEEDRIDMEFSMSRSELLNMLNKGKGGSQYKQLNEKELNNFHKSCILSWTEKREFNGKMDECIVTLPFFKRTSYYKEAQIMEFEWNPEIIPYLRALSTCYTSYSLTEYLKLGTNHAQVLYELMKSYLGQGYITFNLDDLRNKLGCSKQKTYQDFKFFNQKILSKDIKEINENTDITIAITKRIKDSDNKTIKSLLFEIKSKNIKRAWLSEYPTILLTEKEYGKLFHSELNVNLVKQCMLKLHQYLTENPTTPIKNHYRKIMEYYNAWKDTPQWEQLTFSSHRDNRTKSSVRKSNVNNIDNTYNLKELQEKAMLNDDFDI